MFKLKLLLVLLLSLAALNVRSAVFVVTSNADSGPGTLREALTLAANNNLPGLDYINFNLPDQSEAGRTIKLTTQLPVIPSNLVIDGTTQPGSKFGVSDAKIKIETPQNTDAFMVLNLTGVHHVELYGLFIDDDTGTQVTIAGPNKRYGINMVNATDIIIGAPSKGNVIRGFTTNTIMGRNSNTISIGSNFLGLDAGQSNYVNFSGPVSLINCDKINIGGDLNTNIIFCPVSIGMTDLSKTYTIDVNFNNWGVFKDGKSFDPAFLRPGFFRIYTEQSIIPGPAISATATVNIKNNVAANLGTAFAIEALKGMIYFQRNYIGIAKDGITALRGNSPAANGGIGVLIEFSPANLIVGGDDSVDKNYFAFMDMGVYAGFSNDVFVRNNEYQCITQSAYVNKSPKALPPVWISGIETYNGRTVLFGTAEPLSTIDIYSSESCVNAACSIRKRIETMAADSGGYWVSDLGNISGSFYVSSTIDLKTSVIKTFEVNADSIDITYSSCTATGNITGLKVPTGISHYWIDEQGNIVSTDVDLHVPHPGKYQMILGDGCAKSDWFQVDEQSATQFPVFVNTTLAACPGQQNGSISVNTSPLVKSARWTNNLGQTVGTGSTINNLGPGIYHLYLTDNSGCETLYNNYTVPAIAPLQLVPGSAQIGDDECNLKTGSIKNIQITGGTPPYTYLWRDPQNYIFASVKDIDSLIAGTYKLSVSDAQGCVEVTATYTVKIQDNIIPLPVVNDVKVCVLGSEALLVVSNPSSKYTYRLYDTDSSPAPIDEQAGGRFNIIPKTNRNYYVSQVTGSCESARKAVAVTEGLTINIANTFTPNNDGINDNWKIAGIENALAPTVQLFNRNGQKVFESKGYTQPFDGTMNGRELPVGTYYYIINLGASCRLLSGGVTIIR